MPPASKKLVLQQQSIKKMLKERQELKRTSSEYVPLELPDYLAAYTNISPISNNEPTYKCSKMARVWFLDHSNLEEVLDIFMTLTDEKDSPKYSFTSTIIRAVTSVPLRKLQSPFDMFRFNTSRDEVIGRTLLCNPGIKTSEDLKQFLTFQSNNRLELCQVSMNSNNQVHEDAQEFLTQLRRRTPSNETPVIRKRKLYWTIRRKYFERENLIKEVFLKDMNVKQLQDISNFQSIVTKHLAEIGLPETRFDSVANTMLESFKASPSILETFIYFMVDPQYDLICNNMTDEQQDEVADDFDKFYQLTNASYVVRRIESAKRPSKLDFYEKYKIRSQENRKYLPYHGLYYKDRSKNKPTVTSQVSETRDLTPPRSLQSSLSANERTVLQYKSAARSQKNPDLERVAMEVDDDNSSEASRVTTIPSSVVQGNVEIGDQFPLSFLEYRHPPSLVRQVMYPILSEKVFAFTAKKELKTRFPRDFDRLWAGNKKAILVNYFMSYYDGNLDDLLPAIAKCSKKVQDSTRAFIQQRLRYLYPNRYPDAATFASAATQSEHVTLRKPVLSLKKKSEDSHKENALKSQSQQIAEAQQKPSQEAFKRPIQEIQNHAVEAPPKQKSQEAHNRSSQEAHKQPSEETQYQPSQEAQKQSSEESQSSSDVMVLSCENIPVARISPSVKLEKLSQPIISNADSSEVLCLGTFVQEQIVLSDSQDADHSLIQSLQQTDDDQNPFLKEIEEGTQPAVASNSMRLRSQNNYSDDTLIRLRDFEPLSVRHAKQDKERMLEKLKEKASEKLPVQTRGRRPGPKSRKRKADRPGHIPYIDDDSQSHKPGNVETGADQLQDVLIDEFSVFLSSQLIAAEVDVETINECDNVVETPPFTFVKTSSTSTKARNSTSTCFSVLLDHVYFKKNSIFELHVILPQYSLYNVVISGDSIKSLIQVSDIEFSKLLDLLNTIGTYEYNKSVTLRGSPVDSGIKFILQQLDLFFSNLKFKTFQIQADGDEITCIDGAFNTSSLPVDLTSSINSNILMKISNSLKTPNI